MKIAIVSPWAVSATSVGGTERFIMDIAESFYRQGHTADVYMFSGKNHITKNVTYTSLQLLGKGNPVDEYTLSANLGDFSDRATYDQLACRIESLLSLDEYDAVHVNTQLLVKAWSDKRRIFTVHTNPFEYQQAWGEKAYQTMVQLARTEAKNPKTTFVAPSHYYAKKFSELFNCNVIPIPHAIDISRVLPHSTKKQLCRIYKINDDKIHLLLPSRLEPVQKRPKVLFDALSLLSESTLQKIEVLSSGVDEQYRIYRAQFEEQSRRDGYGVHFIRFNNMADAYSIADIIVLPSRSESFGYSALESLSVGKPTLLNNIHTFNEIAEGNSLASFFNSECELAELIENTINNLKLMDFGVPSAWSDRYNLSDWIKSYERMLV